MKTTIKYKFYIGLKDKDNKVLSKGDILNTTSEYLKDIKVIGFNSSFIGGSWEGVREPCLKFEFLNTFEDFKERDLKLLVEQLTLLFNQDCILLTREVLEYEFI